MLIQQHKPESMNIVTIGADILSQKAAPVTDPTSTETQDLIEIMFETMRAEKGVGLAAPQINISKQIAVIESEGEKLVLINPEITRRSAEMVVFPEGCLSVPEKELDILRHQTIALRYIDENGKKTMLDVSGFLAVIVQHEIDHLNGILITDRYAQQDQLRKTFNIPQKIYEKNS